MFEPKTLRHFQHELNHMLKAAADQDPEALADLSDMLRAAADQGIREACGEQRRRNGWSFARYAQAFGLNSAQAAQARLDPKKGKAAR